VLRDTMQRARAFLFAAREDFGIVLVEAQAAGTPVIAFGRGGASETVCGLGAPRPTGVLFEEQTAAAVVRAIHTFEREQHRIKPAACRHNASRFSVWRFHREFFEFVQEQWRGFSDRTLPDAADDMEALPPPFPAAPSLDRPAPQRASRAACWAASTRRAAGLGATPPDDASPGC
jgi:hypothetical protein